MNPEHGRVFRGIGKLKKKSSSKVVGAVDPEKKKRPERGKDILRSICTKGGATS